MSMPERVPTYAELPVVPDAPPNSSWGVFGRDDQLGTLNFLTEERRLAAAQLVKRGAVFNLDLPLHLPSPPFFPARAAYRRTQVSFPGNRGRDDVVDGFWLQCSSQWDSLKHIRHPEYGFYNWTPDEQVDAEREGRLGIDHFSRHGILGRGVLLDVARYVEARGEPMKTHERRDIPLALLQEVANAQGVTVKPGDIVLFRTATAATLHEEYAHPETAVRPSPGGPGLLIDDAMLAWLWDNQVAAIVSDNLAVEVWPAGGGRSLHRDGIALLGLVLGELFDLEALADDCARDHVYECLFVAKPLHLRAGVGSPANALAMK
ncbi:MAG TPA: cyclase family protein [Chloroflexota bacterium]|nr:cyclase family protein [Chloroflexota bacterium]